MKSIRPYPIVALLFILCTCSSNTEVYQSRFTREYENGKSIEVIREDRVTKWTGMITGKDYGGTSTFTYQFNVEPDDYKWEGLVNEAPLALVFCGDETLLRTTERIIKYDSLYDPGTFKDTTLYYKNVDERYFFKWFGEQYFVGTDSVTYEQTKVKCSEVLVPILQ
ncbi:MAG: hypothetical protein WDO15_15130 [Bacteroidota bacterium]